MEVTQRVLLVKLTMSNYNFFLLALMCFLFVGCGESQHATHKVEGRIEFKEGGAPKFGSIEFFHPEKKINARGKIQSDGTFTVGTYKDGDGAIEGDHQITVNQIVTSHLAANAKVEIQHDHGKTASPKYRDYRTSDLKCVIKKGTNQVVLKISAEK